MCRYCTNIKDRASGEHRDRRDVVPVPVLYNHALVSYLNNSSVYDDVRDTVFAPFIPHVTHGRHMGPPMPYFSEVWSGPT